MAGFLDATDKLSKTTGLVAANSDYTGILIFRNKATAGGADYKSPLVFKNAGYTAFAAIYSDTLADTYRLFVDNGAGSSGNTAAITPLDNHWYIFGYIRSGNNHSFYSDGALVGTVVVNIAAVTFAETLIGFDGFSKNNYDVFCFREFNSALTLAQLIAESNSPSPVLGAFSNVPLQSDSVATVGTNLTNSGVSFPYVSPIQLPLTNTSAALAHTIPSFPSDIIQIVNTGGGTNFDSWYLFTAPFGSQEIGTWGFSKNIGSGYRPLAKPYTDPITQLLLITGQNKPIQFPVTPGNTYYMRFQPNGNTTPALLRVQTEVAPVTTLFVNGIAVPDDTPGFPISVVSGSTSFITFKFKSDVAASECGAILQQSGVILIADDLSGNDTFNHYDTSFNLVGVLANTIPGTSTTPRAGSNQTAKLIYFGNNGDATHHAKFSTLDFARIQGPVVELPSVGLSALCGDNNNSILYYSGAGGTLNSNIKRWDITGGAPLTDFLPTVANYQVGDILIMPDTTLLISYFKPAIARDFFVKHYDTAGGLLNTYAFGADHSSSIPRLAYANDNTSFWVWTHPASDPGKSIFRNIKISDGSTLVTTTQIEFSQGVYQAPETAAPLARFGNSNSCPFFILASTTFSGIYIIVHGKTDDTVLTGGVTQDLKIPNPTWRTAQLEL